MKKNFLFLLVVTLVFGLASNSSFAQGKSKVIATKDFARKIKSDNNAVVIDLRTDGEVEEGMIEGAVQLDFHGDGFYDMVQEMDRNKTYYIYCKSGVRSAKAASMMKDLGYKVYDLKGGVIDWQAEGRVLKKKEDN